MNTIKTHPRLFASFLIGLSVVLMAPYLGITSKVTQALVGYDVGAFIFIIWALSMMSKCGPHEIRKRALSQNDGQSTVLILVGLAIIFSTGAIFFDLSAVKDVVGAEKYERLILSVSTIVLSWFFTNVSFTLHYAHDYFFEVQNNRDGGLVFLPASEEPDYFDFLYFAFTLGATAQTADVALASKKMRRTCIIHSILAFFFNTTLVALTINIASGLI